MLEPYDPNNPSDHLLGLEQKFDADGRLIELYIAGDCNDNGIMSSDDAHILLTNCGEFSPWADRLRRGGELAGSKRSLARGIGRLGIDRTCSAKSRSAATNGVIGQGDYDTLANTWGIPESQIPATYTWNDAGQCSVITPKKGDGNVKLEFGYGPDGNRTWKKVYTWNTGASAWNTTPSDHYVYVHLGPELVATLDAGDSFKVLQVYGRAGGTLLTLHEPNDPALTTDDETWYFGHDPFGNPTLLVNAATDALDLGERFDTFGRNTELVSAAGAPVQPFGFGGMQRDDETGLLLTKNGNYFNVNTGTSIGGPAGIGGASGGQPHYACEINNPCCWNGLPNCRGAGVFGTSPPGEPVSIEFPIPSGGCPPGTVLNKEEGFCMPIAVATITVAECIAGCNRTLPGLAGMGNPEVRAACIAGCNMNARGHAWCRDQCAQAYPNDSYLASECARTCQSVTPRFPPGLTVVCCEETVGTAGGFKVARWHSCPWSSSGPEGAAAGRQACCTSATSPNPSTNVPITRCVGNPPIWVPAPITFGQCWSSCMTAYDCGMVPSIALAGGSLAGKLLPGTWTLLVKAYGFKCAVTALLCAARC